VLERFLHDCSVIQLRDVNNVAEMILMHHPTMIILNTRPGKEQPTIQSLLDTGVPIIECILPVSLESAEELGIHAYLTQPISAQTLLDEIGQIEGASCIMIAFSDRSSALLVERMLETSDAEFEIHRVYDYKQGVSTLSHQAVDLVFIDTVMPGTDGLRLLEYMRSRDSLKNLPVPAFTKNVWLEETPRATKFIVHQRDGLHPTEILKFLNAVFEELRPRYYSAIAANLDARLELSSSP